MTTASRRALVLVPAHDEAQVLARGLRAILDGAAAGTLGVVVVCNGSTDGTADVARAAVRAGEDVEVVEIAPASKVAALRAGLERAFGLPVVVVDADVVVPTSTVHRLVDAVTEPGVMVAGARPVVDDSRAAGAVRRYYRVWRTLPYVRGGVIGTGVYALSAQAVAAIGSFPEVVNDDGWVRRRFGAEHRRVVDAPFTVWAATSADALTARRARVINGNRQLDGDRRLVASARDQDAGTWSAVRAGLAARDYGVPDALTFLVLTAVARARAAARRRRGDTSWSTDTSSRM